MNNDVEKEKKKLTQAQRTEISDTRMLEAATDLILEVGTQDTTLKEVGLRAGYSRGLASLRFGSKEGLFLRLQHLQRKVWLEELTEFSAGKEGLEALLATIDAIEDLLANNPRIIKAMYTVWFESVGHKSLFRTHLQRRNRNARKLVAALVEQGIEAGNISENANPEAFALTFISSITGMIHQWLVSPEEVDVGLALDDMREYTTYALTQRKPK